MGHDPNQTVVTYASLEDAASNIEKRAGDLNEDLRFIQNKVKSISSVWEGEAKTAFDSVHAKWDQKATHIHQILNDIAKKVRQASGDYSATDKKAAQSFGG